MGALGLRIVNMDGAEVGSMELNPSVFGCDVDPGVLHRVVTWQLAKRRAGTHNTKTRAQVSGGGRKPWKQKGRGTARSGSNTSPIWVRGGVAHGPKPKSYEQRMNKSMRRTALAGALSAKFRSGAIVVFDRLALEQGKTREMAALLQRVNLEQQAQKGGVLFVLPGKDEMLWRAGQNLPAVNLLPVIGLNVYDILKHAVLVGTEESLRAIEARLLGPDGTTASQLQAA